jgi:prolyl oligopeptidase
LAYSLADGGSDWRTWKVRDLQTGIDLADEVRWVKFSEFGWTGDSGGFFYSRYDQPKADAALTGTNYFQKVYYHRLGTPQSADRLVVARADQPEWGFRGTVTDDGRYLIIEVWRGTENKNQLFFVDLHIDDWRVEELVTGFDAEYVFVGNDGSRFFILTDNAADRRRLMAIDARTPQRDRWQEVIPQAAETISAISLIQDTFFVTYLKDACHEVRLFDTSGQSRGALKLPGLGTVSGFEGKRSATETFYSFTNYVTPPTEYRYELATGQSTVWQAPQVAFRPEDFQTERVFYTSRDGTRVPLIISSKKGMRASGDNPTLLYGYGGFDISITPSYSPANLAWLDLGGVLAVPNLRGGGEYGRPWHEAGMLERKQNVFDDFIAAAEYLIDQRITSSRRLAISGRSNGGLLVGATMAQRPELFAAALPAVGVMDMLRFHKFTIGWAWVNEYGSSEDPAQFKTLLGYSPLHNLRAGVCYPATLITTADRDDRVVPGHSFKFAARLQEVQRQAPADCRQPVLIRVETRAGHGAGTPVAKLIDTAADTWAFLFHALGLSQP